MNTSQNNYDFIERLIFDGGLRINTIEILPESDLLLIITNKKMVLPQRLSSYVKLKGQNKSVLSNYKLIGDGVGINWPELDEDLSLKGFLEGFFISILSQYEVAA